MANLNRVTRGVGLLESYLAKKRADIAGKLIEKTTKNEVILDVGCGAYPYFLTNSNFKKKYGIDPNINSGVLKNKAIVLKRIDIEKEKLPFKDNYFDAVTMLAVFEHINNDKLEFVLKEIFRVLKKDGVFIITTPAPWADWILHSMGKVRLISKEEIEDHKHNHTNVKIQSLLKKTGFSEDNIKNGFFELKMNMWFTARK